MENLHLVDVLEGKWTRDKKERAAPSHVIEKRGREKQFRPLRDRNGENGKDAGTQKTERERNRESARNAHGHHSTLK